MYRFSEYQHLCVTSRVCLRSVGGNIYEYFESISRQSVSKNIRLTVPSGLPRSLASFEALFSRSRRVRLTAGSVTALSMARRNDARIGDDGEDDELHTYRRNAYLANEQTLPNCTAVSSSVYSSTQPSGCWGHHKLQ